MTGADQGAGQSGSDRYQILDRLGSGGMGVVYRARDRTLGRTVALKVLGPHVRLSERARDRFLREMQAISRLDHPNVVRLYHAEGSAETPRCAMELVPGATLAQVLAAVREVPRRDSESCEGLAQEVGKAGHEDVVRVLLPLGTCRWQDAVCRWMAEVSEGLHHAHQAHLIHRDVKPSNVLVGEDGHARIADFGVALLTDDENGDWSAAGTPGFASPELLAADRVDVRSDVYSVGATLAAAFMEGGRPSRDLAAVIDKARSDEREDRYASAGELARDLERVLLGDEVLARRPSLVRRSVRVVRRNPASVLATLLVLGALAVACERTLTALRTQVNAEQALQEESRSLQQLINERDELIRRRRFMIEEMRHLQAVTRVTRLHEELDELWPELPSSLERMRQWREQAAVLTDPSAHLEFLERLTDQTLRDQKTAQQVAADAEQPDWEQADRVASWFHERVQGVVADMRQLGDDVAEIDRRMARAAELGRVTLEEQEDPWEAAITDIFVSDVYDGLEISPQEGLIPLGFDRDSGLYEFWVFATGEQPEWDDDTGRHGVVADSGLVLVLIPGGTYTIGAETPGFVRRRGEPYVDPWANSGSMPIHEVTLAPFLVSKYEMTQAQWRRLTGSNPSMYQEGKAPWFEADELHPVENIRWSDASRVLRPLGLQLPTEAQWEVAARGGTDTPFFTGDTPRSLVGFANFLDRSARRNPEVDSGRSDEWVDDGFPASAPVGSFQPNAFGLHDVAGNVAELCRDPKVRYTAPVINELGEREGGDPTQTMSRGQSHFVSARFGGVARREPVDQGESTGSVGVRPSRDLQEDR